jgi:CRISPR-associated protein Cas1
MDAGFCLVAAQDWISRKLQRQIDWLLILRENNLMARYELTGACRLLEQQLERVRAAATLPSLRGLEGAAAAIYFDGLKAVVPESLRFKGRNRRPPRDPFNATLSLGYTLAHAEIAIALFGAGLDPYVGFYHQLDFGRESLASDLLEPIRPFVDRFALRLFKEETLRADNFSSTESGCLLGKAGRARFYAAWEAASADLRTAINAEVDELVQRLGVAAPPTDTTPGTDPAEEA